MTRVVDPQPMSPLGEWLVPRVPPWLVKAGPLGVPPWHWLAIPLLVLACLVMGKVLGRLTRAAFRHLVARTAAAWDDRLLLRLDGPIVLVWALLAGWIMAPFTVASGPAGRFLHDALRALSLFDLFWAVYRVVDVARDLIAGSIWAAGRGAARALVPLGARVAKVIIVVVGGIAIVSEFGYPVASLLAGLGIGGLAIALAAQKTVENLFGAFSIGVDQPFREGDFVRIDTYVGTVESIGLRSTRLRTLDRTLVTIPNGKLAEMQVESFTARDRMRLACTLGLVDGTTAAQMRAVLAGLEEALRGHPKIWPDAVVVRFQALADFSLNVEVMAWFQTGDWNEFTAIRQELLLQFMEVVERAGSSFAFPTHTVHVEGGSSAGPVAGKPTI